MIIIKSYERIHIDKDEMIYQIAHTKNRKELAEHFGCGINKVCGEGKLKQ